MASIRKRTDSKGNVKYHAQVRIKGRPPETATFARITDAKDWAQQTETDIKRGLHFKNHEAKKRTMAEVIDRYCTDILPTKPKVMLTRKKHMAWWREEIGDYFLSDLTATILNDCKRTLQRTKAHGKNTHLAPATVNRYLISLSDALNTAIREWNWLQDNPMRLVQKLPENNERTRFLNEKERNKLLIACKEATHPMLYPVVVLALSTGARKMEIMNIKWADVDFKRRVIRLENTKNKDKRTTPLTGYALSLLKRLNKVRRIDTDLVFPRADGIKPIEVKKQWEAALKRSKIEDFRFHDLRHSAASYLLESGATLPELSAILGQRTIQMVKRYAHLADNHAVAVAERMTSRIFK